MDRLRDDSGISLAEMLVVLVLMGFVIGVAYMGLSFGYRAQSVAERQSQFARSVTAPLAQMDSAFAQSTAPTAGASIEAYNVTLEFPSLYKPGTTLQQQYTANTDGTLVLRVYQGSGSARTLVRTDVLSTVNANRAKGKPLFTYYNGSLVATQLATADSVKVELVSSVDGQYFTDSRTTYFRNR